MSAEYVEVNWADNGQIVVTVVNDDEYEALEAWLSIADAEALVRKVEQAISRAKAAQPHPTEEGE